MSQTIGDCGENTTKNGSQIIVISNTNLNNNNNNVSFFYSEFTGKAFRVVFKFRN